MADVWTGMAGGSPAGQSLQYLGLWVAWLDDQGQQIPVARRVYRLPRVWAGGAWQQRVHDPRPLSSSFPSLSMGTSH